MSLSLVLILIIPLLLVPSIILPTNRIKVFFISSFSAALPISLILLAELFFPNVGIEYRIGEFFLPMTSPFTIDGMTMAEKTRISAFIFYLLLYLVIYLIVYLAQKIFILGSNVTINWSGKIISHIFYSVFFFATTYVLLALFLVEIRQIIPLPDGIMAPWFNILAPLEA